MLNTINTTRRRLMVGATVMATTLPKMGWAQEGVRGGTLMAIILPEPAHLCTGINSASAGIIVGANIFDALVVYDEKMQPQPSLATSWEIAPDGKSIRFNLRKGVKWHDGIDFTSADVQFSVMKMLKVTHPIAKQAYANVIDVETPDRHTAVFKLSAPSNVLLSCLSFTESPITPKHLYDGTDFNTNPYNNKPVGTGAFMFKEWKRGDYIVLERNPNYWDQGKPYLDKIIFRIIPDAGARAAALETGEVQYAALSAVPLTDAVRLSKSSAVTVQKVGYEYVAPSYFLEFNLKRKPFQDLRVRQAFAHAIDRKRMAQIVWYGFAKPATGPVPSTVPAFYNPKVPDYPYDPKKAEALLDQAGLKRGANGIRLSITHDYMPFGDDFKRGGEFIKQELQKIGVNVTVRSSDVPSYVSRVYGNYDFDTLSTWLASFADPQVGVERTFASWAYVKGTPFTNASGYSSPAVDDLFKRAHVENDPAKRAELYKEFQVIARTDLPTLSLLELQFFTVFSKKLRGVSATPEAGYVSLKNVWFGKS